MATLLLGLRFSRLQEEQVWEELVGAEVPPDDLPSEDQWDTDIRPHPQGEKMNTASSTPISGLQQDIDLRRSSRVERPIPLVILGANHRGETFQEKTSAISVNLHGCRYLSRHDYALDGWVALQVPGTEGANAPIVHARVRSVHSPRTPRELGQICIELETPGNIWGILAPPEDWQRVLAAGNPLERPAASAAPSSSLSTALSSFLDKESAPTKASRVSITADQLLQALQGRIQSAADKAVQVSLSAQFDQAVKNALAKMEDAWRANVRETEEFSSARLAKVQNLWEKALIIYHGRAQEISRRLEALALNSQQALAENRQFVEGFVNETAPQLQARLNDSLNRTYNEFEAKAAEVSGQHLAQISESTQLAAREARAQLDQSIAEVRSLLSSTTGGVSREQVESLVDSSKDQTLNRLEERLGELYFSFEQQHDLARHRTDEIVRQVESLTSETSQARSQYEQSLAEVRSLLANVKAGIPQEQFNSLVSSSSEQILGRLEEFRRRLEGQIDVFLTEAKDCVTSSLASLETANNPSADGRSALEPRP